MMKSVKTAVIALVMVATAGPAVAASPTYDKTFYLYLLNYIKAEFSFNGAEFDAFKSLGLKGAELAKLSAAFANLYKAQLSLVGYLQTKVTVA